MPVAPRFSGFGSSWLFHAPTSSPASERSRHRRRGYKGMPDAGLRQPPQAGRSLTHRSTERSLNSHRNQHNDHTVLIDTSVD